MVGPEFWEDTPEPLPLPPNVKVPTGRPKKKRVKRNDIPVDATRMKRGGTKVRCSHCTATDHNVRTCAKKVVFLEIFWSNTILNLYLHMF